MQKQNSDRLDYIGENH